MITFRKLALLAGVAALPFAAPTASAAPCAGFTDVDDADPNTAGFCSSVEWIRNRGVTVGCTATEYCPTAAVSRLAMAAFMKRLGDALTPVVREVSDATGPIDLDNLSPNQPLNNVCRTAPFTVTDYPRRAYIFAQFAGLAAGTLQIYATATFSTNNGVSFTDVNQPQGLPAGTGGMRTSAWGAGWISVAQATRLDLQVGSTYVFAFNVERSDNTPLNGPDLQNGRCNILVRIESRTGAATPFDAAPASGVRDNAP